MSKPSKRVDEIFKALVDNAGPIVFQDEFDLCRLGIKAVVDYLDEQAEEQTMEERRFTEILCSTSKKSKKKKCEK